MTGWSSLLTSVLAVHLGLSVARVEHLIASDLWILFRGAAFRRRQDELSKTRTGVRRLAYPGCCSGCSGAGGGGTRTESGPRHWLLAMSGYPSKPQRDSWLLLANLSILVIGSVVVAAGGVLASVRIGAFARYHHFGWPPAKPRDLALHELAFVVGSSIIALVVASGLVLAIGAELGGYGSFGPSDGWWDQLWNSTFTAFAGVIGQGFSDPQNGFGVLGLALVGAVQISHVIILLGVTQKTWSR